METHTHSAYGFVIWTEKVYDQNQQQINQARSDFLSAIFITIHVLCLVLPWKLVNSYRLQGIENEGASFFRNVGCVTLHSTQRHIPEKSNYQERVLVTSRNNVTRFQCCVLTTLIAISSSHLLSSKMPALLMTMSRALNVVCVFLNASVTYITWQGWRIFPPCLLLM